MSKIIGLANTCRECPHRRYESGGVYRCEKVGVDLDASCAIPDWCPLPNYPAQAAQPAHAHAIDTSPERVEKQAGNVQVPLESSQEAADAIAVVMKEYNYPANPQNCARVGWRAARLYAAPSTKEDV